MSSVQDSKLIRTIWKIKDKSEWSLKKKNQKWDMHSSEMQKSVSVQVDSDFALILPSGAYEIMKMEPRSKLRKVILFCLLLSLFGMVAFGYFCPDQVT